MSRRLRIFLTAGSMAVVAAIYLAMNPSPPNIESERYTAAAFDFRESDALPATRATTGDPGVIQAIGRVIATGDAVDNCRCMDLGTALFTRADGQQFGFRIMPPHSDSEIRIQIGGNRFGLNRDAFLSAVAPLGLPPGRWTGE